MGRALKKLLRKLLNQLLGQFMKAFGAQIAEMIASLMGKGGGPSTEFRQVADRLGLRCVGEGLNFFQLMSFAMPYQDVVSSLTPQAPQSRHAQSHRQGAPVISNILEGTYQGCQVCLFQMGVSSVFLLEHDRVFPELTIRPETPVLLAEESPWDIDLDSVEFNNAFLVRSPDRKFAYDICHGRMMAALLEVPQTHLAFKDTRMALWCDGPLTADDVEPRLNRLLSLWQLVPQFRESELTNDPRTEALSMAVTGPTSALKRRPWNVDQDGDMSEFWQFRCAAQNANRAPA